MLSRTRLVAGTSAVGIRKKPCSPCTRNRSASNFGSWPVPCSADAMHQVRHVHLGVAVLARVQVEHELRQRAVQPRDAAAHDGEARAGDLRGGFEIEAAELLRRARRDPSA